MADNEETPPAAAPKPPARRAPRKTTPAKSAADKPAPKPKRKPAGEASESAAKPASAARKAPAPPKPRSTKRATPTPKRPAKPKVETPAEAEKQPAWKSKAALAGGLAAVGAAATAALLTLRGSTPKKAAEDQPAPTKEAAASKDSKSGSQPTGQDGHAHMPDGQDATKSFQAGIADENTIPE